MKDKGAPLSISFTLLYKHLSTYSKISSHLEWHEHLL